MRITIVQSEIEQAIRDSILSQITVNEGMQIDITLRATRGAEGYQADIDIRPISDEPDPPFDVEPEAERESTSEKTEPSKPLGIEETVTAAKAGRRTRGAGKATAVQPAAVGAAEEPQSDEPNAAAEEPSVGSEDGEQEAEQSEGAPKVSSIFAPKKDVEAGGEAPAATNSIFGGLKRPVNA